jgi:ArsR family transcriptional regulator
MILEVLKALADPSRLRLAAILLRGEFTVQELTRIMGTGQSRVSHHLKVLTEAGILTVKRQGTWSYYRASGDCLFFTTIRPALEQGLAELPQREQDLAAVTQVLEERRKRSQEFFDRHARQWEDLARTLLPAPEYRDSLLSHIPKGKTVVEIGFGAGGLLAALAAGASMVIGVDHSPAMLEEARRRLAEEHVSDVELRLGEMTHLPLPDHFADCAVLNMVLHHAADPQAVLAEIRRILAPGGMLVLADLARHEREWVRERLADQWLGFGEEELTTWLEASGFAEVGSERIEGGTGEETVLLIKATTPGPS